jgi:hypothetical protein
MISTWAGSSFARLNGSLVSATTRRLAAAATSALPWASRNSASPGCGSRPHRLACW